MTLRLSAPSEMLVTVRPIAVKDLPLNLAAKISMSWGVHSIQGILPILQSSVLGIYGDASLLLEGIAVHEALLGGRMPTVRQQPVHERCLAVIHMSCAS